MPRITLTKSGKSRNAENTGDAHITGYEISLPVGIYHHRQFISGSGSVRFFYMDINQWGGPGYDERPLKLGFSEKEDWDFRIANSVVLDEAYLYGQHASTTYFDYLHGTIRTRKWTVRFHMIKRPDLTHSE